jgi:Putative Ig domain/PASTA domain
MRSSRTARRWVTCTGVAAAAATTVLAGALGASAGAQATTAPPNPYAPSYQHPYRHGAVPTRAAQAKMNTYRAQHPLVQAAATQNLHYGGGVDGIGVTTGPPQVYLVFWGSGWGSSSTNGEGDLDFSNDFYAGANHLQEMFKGLGTGHEQWSSVMTQYCEAPVGWTNCQDSGGPHVGYPLGGALAGVWYDNTAVPATTTAHQIAAEAVNAAGHFGNTTAAANRNAQYMIFSPHNYHPDGWSSSSSFCAWHDWNGDSTLSGGGAVSSSYGDIAFTNLPYVRDAGTNCGQNYVNAGGEGNLDGFSLAAGHEYAETITDQNPPGGWVDTRNPSATAENGDKCAWIGTAPTVQGGAANVVLSTGPFYAMQGTWSNEFNANQGGCAISRPLVTVTNPGAQASQVGLISATVPFFAFGGYPSYTHSASGLPPGLSIDPSSGAVSGIPTQVGDFAVIVSATDSQGFSGSTSLTWSIIPRQGTVPDVTGIRLGPALTALQAAGFTVGQVRSFIDPTCTSIGLVTAQNPAGGTLDELGASVNLTVGQKPPPPFQCE